MCLQHLIYLPIYIFIISIKRILFVKIGKCICELNVMNTPTISYEISPRRVKLYAVLWHIPHTSQNCFYVRYHPACTLCTGRVLYI